MASASANSSPFASTAPLGKGVEIARLDPVGLVALNKPAGVLSHPNKPGEESRSLLRASYALQGECYAWKTATGEPQRAWLLNRLDSATSGIVLLALDEALARHMRELFRQKHIEKTYAALVLGRPPVSRQRWKDRLAVQKSGGRIRTRGQGNIPAESVMNVLRASSPQRQPALTLIQLEPVTGRSHQLRVQCAKRHLPIVGDATYGEFEFNRAFAKQHRSKRLFLHSLRTRFSFDWQGRAMQFSAEAPLPPEFEQALNAR